MMEQINNRKRRPLGAQIADQILDYIQTKPLEIGAKLPNEFELAEIFGVGRSTIREAVKSLVSKGVLEVRRGSGTFVLNTCYAEEDPLGIAKRDDTYQLALELFDVRLMLEPEIAAKAAEYATDEDIIQLTKLCDEVEKMYMDDLDHVPLDIEFHTWIASCSKNRVVEKLIPIIHTSITTFVNITNRKLREETIVTHRSITDAIAAHDSTGARCAMVMHLTYNRQEILKQWKESQEKAKMSDDLKPK